MAGKLEEVIRIVLQAAGEKDVDALTSALGDLVKSGDLTEQQLGDLAGALDEFAQSAADTTRIQKAVDSYRDLSAEQGKLADETERAGLRLKLATEAEESAVAALREKQAALQQAQESQREYQASSDKTREGLREQAQAVRSARDELRESDAAWKSAAKTLTEATRTYESAANAQGRLESSLRESASIITAAGESTDDLAGAQQRLAQRSEAAAEGVRELVSGAQETGAAARKLSADMKAAADAAAEAEAEFDAAFKALGGSDLRDASQEIERLQTAYETLASSGRLSADQLATAQERLAARVERLRKGTAEYRAEQERSAAAAAKARVEQERSAAAAAELAQETARASKEQKDYAAAVDRQKAALAGARAEQDRMNASTERGTGILSKMRGMIASVGAYLGARELLDGVKTILGIGDAAEGTRIRLAQMYGSVERGNQAFSTLRTLARENGLAFQDTLEAAARLKAFGLEPLDGTLQALIDQNAALGGSQQQLEGIILAVGQAWAKQKLQGEEILQLVERGVPVWDLLVKATGKNVQELQKLSEQGKLTRDTIRQLMAAMAEGSSGAAAANINRLSTLVLGLRERMVAFAEEVNNSGAMEYFRERLKSITAEIDGLIRDGRMAQWARSTSDAIIGTAKAVETGVRWLVEYGGAIGSVVKAYAAMKAADAALNLGNMAVRWGLMVTQLKAVDATANTAVGTFGRLGAAIKAIPLSIKIGIAILGYEALDAVARKIAEIAGANSAAAESLARAQDARRQQVRAEIEDLYALQAETIAYRNVQVQGATDVAKLNDAELESYKVRLTAAQEYARQQLGVALREQELYGATEATTKAVEAASARVRELREAWDAVAEGATLAAEAAERGLSVDASRLVSELQKAATTADATKAKLGELFANFDGQAVSQIGDMAAAVANVGAQSDRAGKMVRDGLAVELKKLTGEQLLRFSSAAQAAFGEFDTGAKEAAAVLDSVLLTALDRLGLKGAALGVPFTQGGKDIIATFATVAEAANATSGQIEAAFKAAINAASTREEVEAMAVALDQAGKAGRVSMEGMARATGELSARLRELEAAANPLNDAFSRLGVTSQQALQAAADAAKDAFAQIVEGAKRGEASVADVRRSFEGYARTVLDASKDIDASARQQIEAQLRVEGAAVGATEALERLGLAGKDAGDQTAQAAFHASDALGGVATAAGDATGAVQRLGDAAETAANASRSAAVGLQQVASEANIASSALEGVSQKYLEVAAASAQSDNSRSRSIGTHVDELARQQRELERALEATRSQNAEYDETEQLLQRLRIEYSYISDDRLRQLAQEQIALERNRSEQERALATQRESLKVQQQAAQAVSSEPIQVSQTVQTVQTVRVELTVNGNPNGVDLSSIPDPQMRAFADRLSRILKQDMRVFGG